MIAGIVIATVAFAALFCWVAVSVNRIQRAEELIAAAHSKIIELEARLRLSK